MDHDALFEHQFWLQILGDHSRFILTALAPTEHGDIEKAEQFIRIFDGLLNKSRNPVGEAALGELNEAAHKAASSLRAFKLDLLERLLLGQVKIGMTPTFINHMVNEVDEYIRILDALLDGKPVPHYSSLHHDLLWLPDAAGHAATIAMELDSTEKNLIHKSLKFEEQFNGFYLKALELCGYLRTMRKQYPAIPRFHHDVDLEMRIFMAFLQEIEKLEISNELLSRLNPLVPDHMYREECYYLMKLAKCGQVASPACNPAKPRAVE